MIGLSELRARAWQIATAGAAVCALALAIFAGVQSYRLVVAKGATALMARDWATEKAARAEAETKASEQARLIEQMLSTRMAAIDSAYARGKQDAKAAGDAVAADLRTGNLRLRRLWEGCQASGQVSGAGAAIGGPDGRADDRADSAGRIVGAAAACDAQVKGLQSAIRAYMETSKAVIK
jgi:hypothetical protein